MRKVHDPRMVAHLWANESQGEARTQTGNFYFTGDTIYSYGSHFPIARHVRHKGRRCVLFTTRGYSSTTAKHLSVVRGALHGLDLQIFHVNSPLELDHKANLKAYREEIACLAGKAMRARTNAAWLSGVAAAQVKEANEYAAFFGLKTRFTMPTKLDLEEMREKIRRQQEQAERREAKRAEERAKKEAEERAKLPESVERWRNKTDTAEDRYRMNWYGRETLLRVRGSRLESSRGAIVPLEDAKRLLPLIRRGVNVERTIQNDDDKLFAVGQFKLNRIDPEGNVWIGCHYIERAEIELVAQQLGV